MIYAMHADHVNTEEKRKAFIRYVHSTRDVLPCDTCAEHNERVLEAIQPGHYDTLTQWVHAMHNKVNRDTGRRQVSYEEAMNRIHGIVEQEIDDTESFESRMYDAIALRRARRALGQPFAVIDKNVLEREGGVMITNGAHIVFSFTHATVDSSGRHVVLADETTVRVYTDGIMTKEWDYPHGVNDVRYGVDGNLYVAHGRGLSRNGFNAVTHEDGIDAVAWPYYATRRHIYRAGVDDTVAIAPSFEIVTTLWRNSDDIDDFGYGTDCGTVGFPSRDFKTKGYRERIIDITGAFGPLPLWMDANVICRGDREFLSPNGCRRFVCGEDRTIAVGVSASGTVLYECV